MNKKKLFLFLVLIFIISIKMHGQEDLPPGWEDEDPGNLPIPGILYFLVALIGIGSKKLYDLRKK
jgi:hypothetical protein